MFSKKFIIICPKVQIAAPFAAEKSPLSSCLLFKISNLLPDPRQIVGRLLLPHPATRLSSAQVHSHLAKGALHRTTDHPNRADQCDRARQDFRRTGPELAVDKPRLAPKFLTWINGEERDIMSFGDR